MLTTTIIPPVQAKITIEDLIGIYSRDIAATMERYIGQAIGEADIRHEFASLLRQFLTEAKIAVSARHEYALAGGRIDTKYGAVILEYKNPHSNDRIDQRVDAASTRRLISQIRTRFRDFENEENIEQKRLFGCGTDGRLILFVRNRTGRFEIDPPELLSRTSVMKLLRALVSLGASGASFTPGNLCADFGASSDIARTAVIALYTAIMQTKDEKAKTLFLQWKLLFSEVCGYKVDDPGTIIADLARRFGLERPEGAPFLFALHTYYSVFIKFMGSEIVSAFSLFTTSIIQRCNRTRSSVALRRVMLDLEKGANWKAWGVSNFLEGDLFAWYISAWSDAVAEAIWSIAAKADGYDPSTLSVDPGESQDLLKRLYQDLIPQKIRHDLGEYYTPDWLASHVLDAAGFDGNPDKRILDPGCGSGTFLVEIMNRVKGWFDLHRHECGFDERELARKILSNVVGFDLNPLAVMTSRVNYLIAIRDLIKYAAHIEIPVYLSDSVLTPSAFSFAPIFAEKFDFVVGNPPWINWQHLPRDYRSDLLSIWRRYELLTLNGAAAGLGGSKKDLSMLFTYVSADRYLRPGGRLGFVITQSVFKTKGAGDGFRRFRYEDGRRTVYLRPVQVEDLSGIQVFDGANNRTAMIVLEKSDLRFNYPVDYRIWKGAGRIPQDATLAEARAKGTMLDAVAEPVTRGSSTSPWLTVPRGTLAACRKTLGKSAYRAMAGCTTWLNGVYWVNILRDLDEILMVENQHTVGSTRGIVQVQARIEEDLVYPLIRGEDVFRWKAAASTHIVLPQDPVRRIGFPIEEMQRRYRRTYSYFLQFETALRARSGYKKYFKGTGPFYSIYNISSSTFLPYKVMWRDMGVGMQAAVISEVGGKVPIPEHHVMFVSTKSAVEAHFLCSLLNSTPVSLTVAGYTTNTGMSAHVASIIALPKFSARNPAHQALAELSVQCHAATAQDDVSTLERQIDEGVAGLFSISGDELDAARDGLAALR